MARIMSVEFNLDFYGGHKGVCRKLLAESDWTMLPDVSSSVLAAREKWIEYRRALRAIMNTEYTPAEAKSLVLPEIPDYKEPVVYDGTKKTAVRK